MATSVAGGRGTVNATVSVDKAATSSQVWAMHLDFRKLVPHRPPMLMIDDVTKYGGDLIRARRTVRAGDPFVTNQGLHPAALLEAIAQTIASGDACFARQKGGTVIRGYLTGLTGVKIHGTAAIGDTIDMEGNCLKRMDGMGLFEATAHVGDRLLVEGRFKFFVEIDYPPGTPGAARSVG